METKKLNKLLEEYNKQYQRVIYKMTYFQNEELGAEVIEFLERNMYLGTDYGVDEMYGENILNLVDNFDTLELDKKKSDGTEMTKEELIEGLGDFYQMFRNGDIELAIRTTM